MTISKEKVSPLVVYGPVIASALIKKKMICELMLKENFTPKSVFFLSSPKKAYIELS